MHPIVAGIFETLVLLDRARVGQMNFVPLFHQTVDQPVLVVGRLDDNTLKPNPGSLRAVE